MKFEQAEFIAVMAREFPNTPTHKLVKSCQQIHTWAMTLQTLNLNYSNGENNIDTDEWSERKNKIADKVTGILKRMTEGMIPLTSIEFNGDPRGAAIRLHFRSERGGERGVPVPE